FVKGGAFVSLNRLLLNDRLSVTAGLRSDVNSFTINGADPLQAISPRASASFAINSKWNLNFATGRYAKLPSYTILGYKEDGVSTNRNSPYILCDHLALGTEYLPSNSVRITAEGFFKSYNNYPVSVRNGISLANEGSAYGAIGNEDVENNGTGRAYGFELFFQKKFTTSYYLTASYTFFKSEFTGDDGRYAPSAWDNRHLLSLIFGKKFKRGYELGVKYRFAGGAPYTPYDLAASQLSYLTLGTGVLDYNQINSQRLPFFNQLDIRIDKKINFKKSTLDVFLDIQNVTNAKSYSPDIYTFERNATNTGYSTIDGQPIQTNGSNAVPIFLENVNGNLIPAFGIIFEF
ncbi:MAG: hypothetical protein RL092_1313, partial [Bacteroidota bacterium]